MVAPATFVSNLAATFSMSSTPDEETAGRRQLDDDQQEFWSIASSSNEEEEDEAGGKRENLKRSETMTTTTTTDDDSEEEVWKGQVLKRQMHEPKVPYPLWDYDWDGMMTNETTLEAQSDLERPPIVGKTRHIILIRHGQYHDQPQDDSKRRLTAMGRMQAELTGKRLAVMARGFHHRFGSCPIKTIHSSNLTRARETAHIIAKHLEGVKVATPDPLLNEAMPAPIIPVRPDIDAQEEIDANRDRIEQAFNKYVHRDHQATAMGKREQHEFEVVVCHGNVIRYFFCRALQIPPEAWLRLSVFNCSLTYLVVQPNGYVTSRMLGDVGHLGYQLTTYSRNHGFAWS